MNGRTMLPAIVAQISFFKPLLSLSSFPSPLALLLSQDECVLTRACDVPASPKTPAVRLSLAKVDEV